ncbi:hypothetical protein TWF694_007381 [Orbilia ellipsospora]|uniref:Tail specific protease domain-containing protein n=1 Tax=Orbilia ellipsospora TaxID=2528407 RepID=A0AAV9XP95_9PEZI
MIGSSVIGISILGLALSVNAVALPQYQQEPLSNLTLNSKINESTGGCAEIHAIEESFYKDPDHENFTVFDVDPKIAYDCLRSVPLEKASTLDFLQVVTQFFQFQSTLSYLKNPPANYDQGSVDIIGGLQDIHKKVESGSLTSWYELENQVSDLMDKSHEGHLHVGLPLRKIINFSCPISLVNLSPDGKTLPKVFVVENSEDFTFSASPVTKIDGKDVVATLEKMGVEKYQSPDARWNTAFASKPLDAGQFMARGGVYPGANTFTLTFENGTTSTYNYTAAVVHKNGTNIWSQLKTGKDIWDKYINVNFTSHIFIEKLDEDKASNLQLDNSMDISNDNNTSILLEELVQYNASTDSTIGAPSYIEDPFGKVRGFFMDDYSKKNDKVAVLSINSFVPEDETHPEGFAVFIPCMQKIIELFLAEAKKRGMQKLIIDVRENGGGFLSSQLDAYRQLFPQAKGSYLYRYRHHPASAKLATSFSRIYNKTMLDPQHPMFFSKNGSKIVLDPHSSEFDENSVQLHDAFGIIESGFSQYFTQDKDGKEFATLESFINPVEIHGDKYSPALDYPISKLGAVSQVLGLGIQPDSKMDKTGYEHLASYSKASAPFKPENVVILTDSKCASSCNSFVESLRMEQGIRTIVVGGRPHAQPAAAVGGTRGSQVFTLSDLLKYIAFLEEKLPPKGEKEEKEWEQVMPRDVKINSPPTEMQVNLKDMIRKNDSTQTPLQFSLEPADCKIFYTEKTLKNSHELWTKIQNLAWGGDDSCAWGSLKNVKVLTN